MSSTLPQKTAGEETGSTLFGGFSQGYPMKAFVSNDKGTFDQ